MASAAPHAHPSDDDRTNDTRGDFSTTERCSTSGYDDDDQSPTSDTRVALNRPHGADPYTHRRREGDGPVRRIDGDSSVDIEDDDSSSISPAQAPGSTSRSISSASLPSVASVGGKGASRSSSSSSGTSSTTSSSSTSNQEREVSKEEVLAALHSYPPFRMPSTGYRRFQLDTLTVGGKDMGCDWRVPSMFEVTGKSKRPSRTLVKPQPSLPPHTKTSPTHKRPAPNLASSVSTVASTQMSSDDDNAEEVANKGCVKIRAPPSAAPSAARPAPSPQNPYFYTPAATMERKENIRALCDRLHGELNTLQARSQEELSQQRARRARREQRLAVLHHPEKVLVEKTVGFPFMFSPAPPKRSPSHQKRPPKPHTSVSVPSTTRSVYSVRPYSALPSTTHHHLPPKSPPPMRRRVASSVAHYAQPTAASVAAATPKSSRPPSTMEVAAKRSAKSQSPKKSKSAKRAPKSPKLASSKCLSPRSVKPRPPPTSPRPGRGSAPRMRSHKGGKGRRHTSPPLDDASAPLTHANAVVTTATSAASSSKPSSLENSYEDDGGEQPLTYRDLALDTPSTEALPSAAQPVAGNAPLHEIGGYTNYIEEPLAVVDVENDKLRTLQSETLHQEPSPNSFGDETEAAVKVNSEGCETTTTLVCQDEPSRPGQPPIVVALEHFSGSVLFEPNGLRHHSSQEHSNVEFQLVHPDGGHQRPANEEQREPEGYDDAGGSVERSPKYFGRLRARGSYLTTQVPYDSDEAVALIHVRKAFTAAKGRRGIDRPLEEQTAVVDEDELNVSFSADPDASPKEEDPFGGIVSATAGSRDHSAAELVGALGSSDSDAAVTIMVGHEVVVPASAVEMECLVSHLDFFAETGTNTDVGRSTGGSNGSVSDMEYEEYDGDEEEDEEDAASCATKQFRQATELRRMLSNENVRRVGEDDSPEEQERRQRRQQVRFLSNNATVRTPTREAVASPTDTVETAAPASQCDSLREVEDDDERERSLIRPVGFPPEL